MQRRLAESSILHGKGGKEGRMWEGRGEMKKEEEEEEEEEGEEKKGRERWGRKGRDAIRLPAIITSWLSECGIFRYCSY